MKTMKDYFIQTFELKQSKDYSRLKEEGQFLKFFENKPYLWKDFFDTSDSKCQSQEIKESFKCVISDGELDPKSDLPKEVLIFPIEEGLERFGAVVSSYLNNEMQQEENPLAFTGYAAKGIFIYVPQSYIQSIPLTLTFEGSCPNVRVFILSDQNSVIDIFIDESQAPKNFLLNGYLCPHAKLRVLFLSQDQQMGHASHMRLLAHKESKAEIIGLLKTEKTYHFSFDAKLYQQSDVSYRSLAYLKNCGRYSILSNVSHVGEGAVSLQHVDVILKDQSRSFFQGHIDVEPQAQKTLGYQKNRNLLFGDACHAQSDPYLDIRADDVKASHGATFGRINKEQLFFLQSRGLSKGKSEKLLMKGFCSETLCKIPSYATSLAHDFLLGQEL